VGRNYNRIEVASCKKWIAVKATKSPAKSLVDAKAAPVTPPTAATGTATLWNYQYKNCSGPPSAGVDVFINLTDAAGKPAGGIVTDGTVHTGKQHFHPASKTKAGLIPEHVCVGQPGSMRFVSISYWCS
jgi:hypothetical protein